MIGKIKTEKSNFFAASSIFLLLTGYCLFAGLSLLIPLLLLICAFYLSVQRGVASRCFLRLGFLLALLAASAHAMTFSSSFSLYFIPVAAAPMLTMLLFNDLQLAFAMAFLSASIVALLTGAGFHCMLGFFIGGLTGAYAVRDARTRGTLLIAGLLSGAAQAAAFFLSDPRFSLDLTVHVLRPLLIGGFVSGLVVLATLKVFESFFGEVTNFSLLELSDALSQPLLRRMAFEAPGTYHHSLVVSNLAGEAADTIGANSLLTRVGAYYHDIGKIGKPDFFVENHSLSANRHENLEPSMSRLVILNHVRDGVELARQSKLNQRIIDFIEQHHGTSLIYYFYQRALEEGDIDSVQEQNYRYPGPKPQTRETALVMLADAVEGATRAIEDHTPTRISAVARKIVNNKFIDGQLDECPLTLRECELICESFTRTLSAMYHVRIKYPERKNAS